MDEKNTKIDFHTHTRSIKKGERKKDREMPLTDEAAKEFIRSRVDANVKIIAITNHNIFDEKQFELINRNIENLELIVFPGCEIDVNVNLLGEEGSKSRNFNIIVSPENSKKLNSELLQRSNDNYENFSVSLEELLNFAKKYEAILIAPSKQKDGALKDDVKARINMGLINSKSCFYYGATNAHSAAIYEGQGQRVLVGSDNDSWKNFINSGKDKRDELPFIPIKLVTYSAIKDYLHKNQLYGGKVSDSYELKFLPEDKRNDSKWEEELSFSVKKGTNIIIGPRGSGKTVLLENIKDEIYKKTQQNISIFSSQKDDGDNYDEKYKLKRKELTKLLDEKSGDFEDKVSSLYASIKYNENISYSNIKSAFLNLKEHVEQRRRKMGMDLLKLSQLKDEDPYTWNKIKKNSLEAVLKKRKDDYTQISSVLEIVNCYKKNSNFSGFSFDEINSKINEFLSLIKKDSTENYLNNMKEKIIKEGKDKLKESYTIKRQIQAMPSNIELFNLWQNKNNFLEVKNTLINYSIDEEKILLGSIINKQKDIENIYLVANRIVFTKNNLEKFKNSGFSLIKGENTNAQKFLDRLEGITVTDIYSNEFPLIIKEISDQIETEFRKKPESLLRYVCRTCLEDGTGKNPSSGEKQIMMLLDYINDEKMFYIFDEPEKSLDNRFVNDFVLSKINLLSTNGFVIMSTHNANLGVLLFPQTVIYRRENEEQKGVYETFLGENQSENLENGNKDVLKWKEVAENILEGGSEAFNKRGDIYGEFEKRSRQS